MPYQFPKIACTFLRMCDFFMILLLLVNLNEQIICIYQKKAVILQSNLK